MDLELIRKLYNFDIYANLGFEFDGIDKFEKYTIAYHNKIKDYWYNFISDISAENKEEFNKNILEAEKIMSSKNRKTTIAVLPFNTNIYNDKERFFDKDNYELVSKEVWQIYDNFDNLQNPD